MAQCLISIFLRKPDFARARPSTLLTDDETYKKLYEDTRNLLLPKKIQKIKQRIESGFQGFDAEGSSAPPRGTAGAGRCNSKGNFSFPSYYLPKKGWSIWISPSLMFFILFFHDIQLAIHRQFF